MIAFLTSFIFYIFVAGIGLLSISIIGFVIYLILGFAYGLYDGIYQYIKRNKKR